VRCQTVNNNGDSVNGPRNPGWGKSSGVAGLKSIGAVADAHRLIENKKKLVVMGSVWGGGEGGGGVGGGEGGVGNVRGGGGGGVGG